MLPPTCRASRSRRPTSSPASRAAAAACSACALVGHLGRLLAGLLASPPRGDDLLVRILLRIVVIQVTVRVHLVLVRAQSGPGLHRRRTLA
jgi:hypothetical protein